MYNECSQLTSSIFVRSDHKKIVMKNYTAEMVDGKSILMFKCIICDLIFAINSWYGDTSCPFCGQQYEYEEGITIKLSDKQMVLLKERNNWQKNTQQ